MPTAVPMSQEGYYVQRNEPTPSPSGAGRKRGWGTQSSHPLDRKKRKHRWGGPVPALRELVRMQIGAGTPPPLEIVYSKMSHARHDDNHLELEVEGRRMKGECHRVQLRSKFRFAPELGLSDACPPAGVDCKRDGTGAYLLWQSTSVQEGLQVLQGGEVLPDKCHRYPTGVYAYAERNDDFACQVGFQVAGVLGPRTPSQRIAHTNKVVPLGFIVVHPRVKSPMGKSALVCHPNGCEVKTIRFHYRALIDFLQASPLADRIDIPPAHLERRVGGPDSVTRKRQRVHKTTGGGGEPNPAEWCATRSGEHASSGDGSNPAGSRAERDALSAMTRRRRRSRSRSKTPVVMRCRRRAWPRCRADSSHVCIKWNTYSGCRHGSSCRFLHLNYNTSEVVGDGANPLAGIIDAMRLYLESRFSIHPKVVLLQAAKNHLLSSRTDIVKTIVSFLNDRKALPPVQIQDLPLGVPSVEEHPKGRMVVFQLEGQRMSPACLALQRDDIFFFDPAKGWAPASTPAGIDLPEMDASGCYLLYHCTSVQQGLDIMKDAKMRVLSTTPQNWPQGIYTAKRPAEWYNKGCIIKLRIAGVVGSKAVSHQVSRTTDMCPLGFIPVLRRSVQEWVCHPDGCELVEIRFHYEALVGVLQESPNGYRMQLPRLPYQQPRGSAALLRREWV